MKMTWGQGGPCVPLFHVQRRSQSSLDPQKCAIERLCPKWPARRMGLHRVPVDLSAWQTRRLGKPWAMQSAD